ncbi:MAG: hypothetical protein D6738_05945 [Acidobacteria bacterium]|nr:MAG: hypothetical protein D6738_05945 [Acidobacteriota bacterium]
MSVWAYVAPDAATCRALLGRGCERVFVDDYPRLARELGEEPDTSAAVRDAGPRVLVLDLGSSSIRASLVRPGGTILATVREPTPGGAPEDGPRAEHDATAVAEQAARQIVRLAHASDGPAPVAAAIASQRSTGLWVGADGRPVGPAVSWRDGRGAGIVARLESRAAEFERITGLPLDAAWTAVTARATLGDTPPPPGWRLVPLGSHVASRLTGEPPDVDPTLANRTFLLDAEAIDWSPVMLEAFGFETSHLPPIAPTVCPRGRVPWPGTPQGVPLLVLVGDQQAAYVGIAGPAGRRLALNVGTAGFAMRGRPRGTPRLPGIRRAPLWTSERHRLPPAVLDEIPVPLPDDFRRGPADDAARALARAVAFGEKAPADWVAALGTALTRLREVRDASVRVAGGWANAPHLVALLRSTLDLSVIVHEQTEATTVGAARLACAGAGLAWPGG